MPPTKTMTSEKVAPLGGRGFAALPIDRVLPNSLEAEMAVLGAMLLSPQDAASQARERLSDHHFYHSAHQVIFREIGVLQDAMQAVDMITLTQRLQDKNQRDEIGGAVELA